MIQALAVPNKYAHGRYAVCPSCGCRPCVPDCNGASSPSPTAPMTALRPRSSGNAIPFIAFDGYSGLTTTERLLLLYLCRLTFGYGRHAGDLLSLGQLAERSGLSRTAVRRALNGLERRGLIARSRRFERASKERAATHIEVVLPSEVEPETPEVGSQTPYQVGSQTPNGRVANALGWGRKRPYLKASPKSLPKEGEPPPSLEQIQLHFT